MNIIPYQSSATNYVTATAEYLSNLPTIDGKCQVGGSRAGLQSVCRKTNDSESEEDFVRKQFHWCTKMFRILRVKPLAFLLVLVLLCFFAAPTSLISAEESLEVVPHWKTGEKLRYEMAKTRQRLQQDKVVQKSTIRIDLEIEVLSASEDSYILGWTFGEAKFDDPKQAADPLARLMANLLKDHRIILELDSQAGIIGIQNWKDMQKTSAKALDIVIDNCKARGVDQKTIASIRSTVMSMFSTKQQAEKVWTQEAELFFMAHGIQLTPSKPLEYSDSLPNPFGGEPLPTRARFVLTEVNQNAGRVTIAWTQTIVPEDAQRIVEKIIKDMAQRMGQPFVLDREYLKSLMIEDTAEYVLDRTSGWIHAFMHSCINVLRRFRMLPKRT